MFRRPHNAQVKRISWTALFIGLAATVIVELLSWLGLFTSAEYRSVDYRYQHARTEAQPLSEQIAIVAIDNGSLDTIGRWPWPRTSLAVAMDELARAGARTVAVDLLLSEPDSASTGDVQLADAMAKTRTVLGLDVSQKFSLGKQWQTSSGQSELAKLLEVLSSNIDGQPTAIAQAAGLSAGCRDAFLESPLSFKAMAAWQTIWRLTGEGEVPGKDELFATLLGGRTNVGRFDARKLVDDLWQRAKSWQELSQEIVRTGDRAALLGGHQHQPAIPELARIAAGLGVVTSDLYDSDGAKRRTGPAWDVPGGKCHQFGVVAAATYLGVGPGDIAIDAHRLTVGDRVLPLEDGVLHLDWPTSTFAGFPCASGFGDPKAIAISIGSLVSIGIDRLSVGNSMERRDATRVEIERTLAQFATPEVKAMSHGDFAQILSDASQDDRIATSARDIVYEYLTLFEASEDGVARLADESAMLAKLVQDKLVFVGWVATGALADQVETPLGPETPGVFLHAVIADMVLSQRSRETPVWWIGPLSVLLLGGLTSLMSCRLPTLWSTGGMLALLGGWLWFAGIYSFNELHLVMPLVSGAVAPIASWATSTAAIAIVTSRDRARITRQFSARVSPQLVEQLASNPDALTVSGTQREITVMFGDLAGFTTIAEKLGGPGVVKTLNLYLGRLSDELVSRGAYVNKFLGDGFMAFWSAFADEPRQESLAAESAVACQAAMADLARSAPADGAKVAVRLGIATGIAVVGDCGAPPKLNDYTAIGDVVNLASRLESANKQFGTGILMDGRTYEGMRAQGVSRSVKVRPLGRIVVVGQSVPIEVFELVASDASDAWIEATAHAVDLFRQRDMSASRSAWIAIEEKFGSSKLSKVYLDAIDAGDGAEDGVLHLRAK